MHTTVSIFQSLAYYNSIPYYFLCDLAFDFPFSLYVDLFISAIHNWKYKHTMSPMTHHLSMLFCFETYCVVNVLARPKYFEQVVSEFQWTLGIAMPTEQGFNVVIRFGFL